MSPQDMRSPRSRFERRSQVSRAARRSSVRGWTSRSALAAEQPAATLAGRRQPCLDRADLARRLRMVRLELEDLLEVAERLLVTAEHALDAAEVEPRALGALRLEHRALEDLAGLDADPRLVARGAEL